jgi:hypothetical protein
MTRVIQEVPSSTTSGTPSAFIKPLYKKNLAVMGTTGLVLGLGLTGSSPANAVVAPFVCTAANRAVATGDPDVDFDRINFIHNSFYGVPDPQGQICLSGNFVLDRDFDYGMDVHFYGEGNSSSISHPGGQLFGHQLGEDYTLTIENLTVKNSTTTHAIKGKHVVIKNSTFSGNTGGAVWARGDVTVTNSVFSGNSGGSGAAIFAADEEDSIPRAVLITGSTFYNNEADFDGGAVFGYGSVEISNSTFVDNTAKAGGAVYVTAIFDSGALNVTNSTFKNNVVSGDDAEGGALFAESGQVIFSTFVDNTAPSPVEGGEKPGNAIYKYGSSQFNVGGNIFAGSSSYPQLGYGVDVSPFIDLGGNVFSTSSATETDITQDDSSVFGASLISIFGTTAPVLATFSPNSSGTQTIGLAAGSPALNIVPNDVPFTSVTSDQRGATRSHPADAGAFEGVVAPTPTPTPTPSTAPAALAKTGSQDPLWASIATGSMLVIGGLVTAIASRLRRQTK